MKHKVTKKISIIAILLLFSFYGVSQRAFQRSFQRISQPTFDFVRAEAELVELFTEVVRGETHQIRYNANLRFLELLKSTLAEEGAFDYPFADLHTEILMPPDRKFRLFNWMVRRESRGMDFFAVMMVRNEQTNTFRIIQLIDDGDAIFDLPNTVLNKNSWFGARYYQLIQTEHNGRRYYTLLGANANDRIVNRRVIEVMTFRPNGDPVFGADVFTGVGGRRERIRRKIFEFRHGRTMILRYDFQAYHEPIGGPPPRPGQPPRVRLVHTNMIVFDRLMPPNADLRGRREVYIAAGGVYDAFVWKDGRWTLKLDIRARNPAPPRQRWWRRG